jgi:Asp-tRNA(Asn)/Glu-tRNA(Gln) amidotransferase A subunit family amidase
VAADGLILKLIKSTGAIPFVTSATPQLLFTIDNESLIYGRTLNPLREERISGGSSGGEAALIASGCSPIGIGGDIGGSIRIPAAYCGISGLKPTAGRLPTKGNVILPASTMGNIAIRVENKNSHFLK